MKTVITKVRSALARFDVLLICILALALRSVKYGDAYYGTVTEFFRDMLVLLDMTGKGTWLVAGPPASVGGMSFGPVYYYLLLPFFYIGSYRPAAVVLASAFFSVAAIFLSYKLLDLWLGRGVARLGALAMAVAMFDIQNAAYVSNPNLLPFFVVLFFYILTRILMGQRSFLLAVGLGICLGIATQLHPTALLLLPAVLALVVARKRKSFSWQDLLIAGVTATISYLPYLFLQVRNSFQDYQRVGELGVHSFGWIKFPSVQVVVVFWDSLFFFRNNYFNFPEINRGLYLTLLPFYFVIILLLWWTWRVSKTLRIPVPITPEGKFLLTGWITLGTAMLLFYQGKVPHFYFLVLWPLPAFFLAWLVYWLAVNRSWLAKYVFGLFLFVQFIHIFYFFDTQFRRQYDHTDMLNFFQRIRADAESRSFNIISDMYNTNQFLYYSRLAGLRGESPQADVLYLVRDAEIEESIVPNPEHYLEVSRFSEGPLAAVKYERRDD